MRNIIFHDISVSASNNFSKVNENLYRLDYSLHSCHEMSFSSFKSNN